MEHAPPPRERRPNAETPARQVDLERAASRSSAGKRVPELRLLVVGGDRIDVAAIGDFDAAFCDDVASRLDRLVAGGPGCLHVDCSRIVSIDHSVADVFAEVRDRLQSRGGTLELVDAPPELLRVMNETVNGTAAPDAAAAASMPAVAS